MIKILSESNNVDLTNEQIQTKYDEQLSRIKLLAQTQIDVIVEKLYKSKDAIVNQLIRDYISSYYLQKDNSLDIIEVDNEADLEDKESMTTDRNNEIAEINILADTTDDSLLYDINEIISKMVSND